MRQLRAGFPKRRAGGGVNGKQRRNKQKALAFLLPQARDYFCIISSCFTERVEHSFRIAFFGSFLGETRNERKDYFKLMRSVTS